MKQMYHICSNILKNMEEISSRHTLLFTKEDLEVIHEGQRAGDLVYIYLFNFCIIQHANF